MTACVNRKHSKKVAAVVTASLVGALSLGVAPVTAMAQGVDMLAADTQDSLRDGEVIEWTDQDDDEIDTTEFAYNGEAQYVIPSLVKPRENSAFEFPKEGYKVAYYEKTATKDRHASTTLRPTAPSTAMYSTTSVTRTPLLRRAPT